VTLVIPADLDTWNPSDVQDWLAALHEDPSVTPDELARATGKANAAILGEDYEDDADLPENRTTEDGHIMWG
jgi:hypothetical protein